MILLFITLGPVEFSLILGIVLLLFGSRLIPWVFRRLGRSAEHIRHADEDFNEGRSEAE